MKVLVTGGAGFIGSHVVEKLQERGIEVYVYYLPVASYQYLPEGTVFIPGSILDMESLRVAMSGMHAVYHLAAIADGKDVYEDPIYAESVNVRGTINVLEAARHAKVSRVIYGSTTWVYSEADSDVVDEETSLRPPTHLHTATKLTSEYYCISYDKLYGVASTILRYGIPYGPRSRATRTFTATGAWQRSLSRSWRSQCPAWTRWSPRWPRTTPCTRSRWGQHLGQFRMGCRLS